MKLVNRVLAIYLVIIILVSSLFLGIKIPGFYNMAAAKKIIAAGGYSVETGFASTVMTECMLLPPLKQNCGGGQLCFLVDQANCEISYNISGVSSGGSNFLGSIIIDESEKSMSGYKPGDSLIAGGTTYTSASVVATPGGCYGCSQNFDP